MLLHPIKLPPRLAVLTSIDATVPTEWPEVVARLCKELQRPVPGPAPRPLCPYPGMSPFLETDTDRFFGRADETQEMLERLRLHPFLAVIGPSGSGKSSIVSAGLIPKLRQSGLFGPGKWLVYSLRPGDSPLGALAASLNVDLSDPHAVLVERLAAHANADHLLLVVDQFEEVFTVARRDVIEFQQTLLRLIGTRNCYIVLTVRADFYADLMESPLWREVRAHRQEVVPLNDDALLKAIMQPAEEVGVYVEAALVERLVADAAGEPGILPLIQETLFLLWERLERRYLPLKAYEALVLPRTAYGDMRDAIHSGLHVAIARRAEDALDNLTPEQQPIAARIFLRLVQFGEGRADTRRQQSVTALRSAEEDPLLFEQTLQHLANRRLLTLTGREESAGRLVDMAHEALITGWPTLRRWLTERREAEQARRLESAADEWSRLGKGSGGLLDEIELLEAERWLSSRAVIDLGSDETLLALISTSKAALEEAERQKDEVRQHKLAQAQALAEEQRRLAEEQHRRANEQAKANSRLRLLALVLAVMFVVAAGALVYARGQQRLALARQLLAQSQSIFNTEKQLDLAILLSLESNNIADTAESRGQLLAELTVSPHLITFLRGHTGRVRSVTFSPDGTLLASSDQDGRIILWDTTTHQPLDQPLAFHVGEVKSLAFSRDAKVLASGGADHTIMLWNVAGRRPLDLPLAGHTDSVMSVAFSPDGTTLASGSADHHIVLWNVASGQQRGPPLKDHMDSVVSVAFSPDGKLLASGSADNSIILWDVATGRRYAPPLLGHSGSVMSVAFSPDGKILASASSDQTIILWDVANRQRLRPPLKEHTNRVETIAFSPDGKTLASGSDDQTIILWDVASGQHVEQPWTGHSGEVWSVAFSPDGKTLASGSRDSTIILWDIKAHPLVGMPLPNQHNKTVWSVAFSPDGKTLASGSFDDTIRLWDTMTRQPLGQPLADPNPATIVAVAFSPDGKTLAGGSCVLDGQKCTQGKIRLWNGATHQLLDPPLIGHGDWVRSVAFSPNGKTLASGSTDGTVMLWDIDSRPSAGVPLKGHTASIQSVAFSPDGKLLASGSADNTIILWDLQTHQRSGKPLEHHTSRVDSVAFSPDGKLLASGSADSTVILWDVQTQQLLGQPLKGHTGPVTSLSFSNNGKMLASGSEDTQIILWDMDFESWRARACARAARNLTTQEWHFYVGSEPDHKTCPGLP